MKEKNAQLHFSFWMHLITWVKRFKTSFSRLKMSDILIRN